MKKILNISLLCITLMAACTGNKTTLSEINRLEKKGDYCDSLRMYDTAAYYYVKSVRKADSCLLATDSANKKIYQDKFISLTHKLTKRAWYFELRAAINEDKNNIDSAGIYTRQSLNLFEELLNYTPANDTIIPLNLTMVYLEYGRFCMCNEDIAHALYDFKDAAHWARKSHNAENLIESDRGLAKAFRTVKLSAKDSATGKINLADSSFKYLALTCRDMDSLNWDKISPQQAYESYNLMIQFCQERKDTARYRLYADKCKNLNAN